MKSILETKGLNISIILQVSIEIVFDGGNDLAIGYIDNV